MKTTLLNLLILLLTAQLAPGRIGEDIWQLRTRYGKEVSDKDYGKSGITYHFRKNKINITCHTYQGKTVTIKFTVELQNIRALDLQTVAQLVAVNSGPEPMERDDDNQSSPNDADWKSKDGTRRAYLYHDTLDRPILIIGLNEFLTGLAYIDPAQKPSPPPARLKDF
jgi:hypothetical protein